MRAFSVCIYESERGRAKDDGKSTINCVLCCYVHVLCSEETETTNTHIDSRRDVV